MYPQALSRRISAIAHTTAIWLGAYLFWVVRSTRWPLHSLCTGYDYTGKLFVIIFLHASLRSTSADSGMRTRWLSDYTLVCFQQSLQPADHRTVSLYTQTRLGSHFGLFVCSHHGAVTLQILEHAYRCYLTMHWSVSSAPISLLTTARSLYILRLHQAVVYDCFSLCIIQRYLCR